MKTKRVLVIDPEARTVTEAEVTDLRSMQLIVRGLIERALIFENGDELYVNEEGLFHTPNYFFEVKGFPVALCGRAYVIGSVTPSGNNRASTKFSVDELKKEIRFLGKGEVR